LIIASKSISFTFLTIVIIIPSVKIIFYTIYLSCAFHNSNETSSFAGNSNKTFEPGKSNITNPTNDHESRNNGHDPSTDSTASDKQNVKEDKDTNEQEQDDGSTKNGDTDQP
jgi:hypothetical protein